MHACQLLLVCLLWGAATDEQTAHGLFSDMLTAPRWEIAPEFSWYRYEEPGIMKNTGMLYGIAASYTQYKPRRLFRAEGGISVGEVEYEGSLMDGEPYTMDGNHDYLLNLRLLWGHLWEDHAWDSQLYTGLGYRFLADDSTQDPAGYARFSNYFYLPLGLKTYHALRGHWWLTLGAEFDMLLIGVQISGIEFNGDSSVTNVQWPGLGARASLELRRRTRSLDLALAPFIQYWWVDDSSTVSDGVYELYEPRNNTIQYGLSLLWRF